MPIGVVTNIATVLLGTTVGALAESSFPKRIRATIIGTLGLLTAAVDLT